MRRHTPRTGSAAIEFALTLPIWLAIVFALVDFGFLYYRFSALDNAANVGCREGAIVDPGDADQHIDLVINRASDRMREVMTALGDEDCDTCVFDAYTLGTPPQRSLVCVVTRHFDPMLGLFVGPRTLRTVQVARLEWQREAP